MREVEVFTEIVASEGECATSVLFFSQPNEVGGETDLGLHLFFAVAEVVIGDSCDDSARCIAASEFESAAIVIEFVFLFPAHAVTLLALGGVSDVGQAKFFLRGAHQVRGKDNATAGACPMLRIEGGIIISNKGVASVAKNRFDEVEVTD